MATIQQLDSLGKLNRYEAFLPAGTLPCREIYFSQVMYEWHDKRLPEMKSYWGLEFKPDEQVLGLLVDYISGVDLSIGDDLKLLTYESGVWEFKTPDVRIFGWFPKKDCFIAVCADDATFTKTHRLYHGYIGQAVDFREKLDLDCPKYIEGVDPYAVVSNYHYP